MRTLITTLSTACLLGLGMVLPSHAAPIDGFESLYSAVLSDCSLPTGTVPNCEKAITAYSGALIGADIDIDEANTSFSAARSTVYKANASNRQFRAEIDALFELLLPNSGAIPDAVSDTLPG